MLPARRPTTPRCLGPKSLSSIEWQASHPWYRALPWAASPLGALSAEAGIAATTEAAAKNALTMRSLMLSVFRFIGLPSCLLEDKTAAKADLFPLIGLCPAAAAGHRPLFGELPLLWVSRGVARERSCSRSWG